MPKGLKGYKAHLKFIHIANIQKIVEDLVKEWDIGKEFSEWLKYGQHPISHSAFRLTRILSVDMMKLDEFFNLSGRKRAPYLTPKCLITMTPNDPTKLRVYPNLNINWINWDKLKTCNPYANADTLKDLIGQINSDMDSTFKAKAWSNFAHARKRLKKYEDIDAVRALTRYCNFNINGCVIASMENCIKGVAEDIIQFRKPVELTFAKTPSEIKEMYSNGPSSCMVQGGGGDGRAWAWLLDKETHPCAFFSYHPYIRGVYVRGTKGTVRSRTFLYTKEDGKEYYGRIYGSTDKDVSIMQNALELKDIHKLPITKSGDYNQHNISGRYWRSVEFDIPGLKYNGYDWMPFPYLDNMRGNIVMTYDEKEHKFHIKCHNESEPVKGVVYHNYTAIGKGAIPQTDLTKSQYACAHCGNPVNVLEIPGRYTIKQTGERFCTNKCMAAQHYCIAREADGIETLFPVIVAIKDEIVPDRYYTTLAAAEAHGVMEHTHLGEFQEEVPGYTAALGFVSEDHKVAFNRSQDRTNFLNRTLTGLVPLGAVEELKKIEIDFEAMMGYTIQSGEIPDQILFSEPSSDDVILSFVPVPQEPYSYEKTSAAGGYYYVSALTGLLWDSRTADKTYVFCPATEEAYPLRITDKINREAVKSGSNRMVCDKIKKMGLAQFLASLEEDEELAMAA